MSISIGILGATGYTGIELIRLLYNHPEAKITYCSSRQYNGKKISDVLNPLKGYLDIELEPFDAGEISNRCDMVFSCLPHGKSMEYIPLVLRGGVDVIDLSADYRLKDISVYQKWYQKHTSSHLLPRAVYGLCEVYRDKIKGAGLVANPGCYPTSVLLPLIPLIKEGLIESRGIVVDTKSGVSGAGKALSLTSHICEAGESFSAYKVGRLHRHIPEIEQELSLVAGEDVFVDFTPHLIPISRGMLSTIYVSTSEDKKVLMDAVATFYKGAQFVDVLEGVFPSTKDVRGTNHCLIGITTNSITHRAIIVSVIDNLTKGASGQAIQNMNIMRGLDEATGLDSIPLFP
ncbi:MAG: N-acetyl-gamma-glutamyl-phosphate reductase [Thermodesulfobacteriota bacterium]|nr:N-acetyl-gamma-glutamyl-phosphate reductase [Thermodesulfobacteriota bacterium]